jgi:pimeloyl-ACP methyl ester carboxylesterase
VIAFDDAGEGTPVVLFHGAPGSRRFGPGPLDGIRLVTFDRPGYGDSEPQPGRTVLDTAHDVAQLVDRLGIERFAVIGWSGGGPFACATAFAYPDRVTRCAIVSAPGPLDEVPDGWALLGDYQRPTAEMARVDPARSERAIARHMTEYIAHPSSFLGAGNGPDGPILRGPHRPMLDAQIALALQQGAAGIAQDLVAMWLDWGFSLAAVRTPTRVWHGARDPHNDVATQTYAARIPGADRVVWPESAHLGLVEHWAEVRDWAATGNGDSAA